MTLAAKLGAIGLVVSVVLFAVDLPGHADRGSWGALAAVALHHGYTLALLLAVTFFTRSRTTYHVAGAWLGGYFLATGVAFLVLERTRELLEEHVGWQPAVAVPLGEEAAKALPLLVVYLVFRARPDARPTVSDFAVLGFAAGAGFAFHEDALWARTLGSGWDLGWGAVLPGTFRNGFFAAGQAVWTGVVGLGFGLLLARRGRPLAWLPLLLAYLLVVADHGAINDRAKLLPDDLRSFLLDGRLTAIAFLVGTAVAVIVEARALGRLRGRPLPADVTRAVLATVGRSGEVGRWRRWQHLVLHLRLAVLRGWRLRALVRDLESSPRPVAMAGADP